MQPTHANGETKTGRGSNKGTAVGTLAFVGRAENEKVDASRSNHVFCVCRGEQISLAGPWRSVSAARFAFVVPLCGLGEGPLSASLDDTCEAGDPLNAARA